MDFQPKGIIPAMVTPVTSDGKINVEALQKLTNYLIQGGVHGLFPVGSQGEFYALTFEEKKRVIEVVVRLKGESLSMQVQEPSLPGTLLL